MDPVNGHADVEANQGGALVDPPERVRVPQAYALSGPTPTVNSLPVYDPAQTFAGPVPSLSFDDLITQHERLTTQHAALLTRRATLRTRAAQFT
ncbi:hypothetical protein DXG01_016253 [Tephrocybe rancida]|nr:hypothetical protein DXG01_016253 [Tephrocybe rancida]